MPTFDAALRIVLAHAAPLDAETVPALDAVGRALAEGVAAPHDFPSFDNSAMDGFAVRAADVAGEGMLPVSAYVPAGAAGAAPLAPGTAARILTGAPVPEGADTVVPIEEAEERPGGVLLRGPLRRGAHVRRRGEDLRAGELALPAGTRVGPAEAACLASFGRAKVAVHRRPRVAILSTGDELVPAGEPLGPGQIHDSNGPAVAAAVLEAGGLPVPLGIARDDPAALRALLARGLEADVLVTTAGVSAGDRDHVRGELEALGVTPRFWKVEVKPGHPTAFGVRGRTLVFSLPGNPVSTLVLFEQLVRPALLLLQGHPRPLRPTYPAVLDEQLPHRGGRVTFSRVVLERRDGALHARSAGSQETGIFRTLLRADGLALLPPDRGEAKAGAVVRVQLLRPDLEAGALPDPPAE